MKIELSISSIAVLDAILSGVEGGIQYWAAVAAFSIPDRTANREIGSATDTDLHLICDLIERESGERFSLQGKWGGALRLMAERCPKMFGDLMARTGDASTGDVLIQLATFGELRYR